ncbi:linker for activation of T-cells family member 2 isoform X3 [Pantherophis guttatus]|uniref:Linker for activation of T-cells family member 2 isoform X3 n=1 Tax=Pantherophis guttatus TaxID=94885 RepID=A0A6P9BZG0_PANGU|nr:linker for activation of T-cells family member 2 isoform X3 [Pantherophis guttatus]
MGQVELIWGAFSLMILGALISMCMKCQQTGSKQEKANVDNQRTQWEDRQGCDQGPYLSSVSKESQMKETYHTPKQSKSRKLSSFNDLDDDSHGYQNVIGTIKSNRLLADEDIYENNLAIQIWKQAQISESDSANCEEEESIYINTEQYSSSQGRDVHL